jgi:hypothetical protein
MSSVVRDVLPSPDPARDPRLSAILVICGPFRSAEKVMRHLAAQSAAADMELIVATDIAANFDEAGKYFPHFAAVQKIVGDVRFLPALRAACVMRARAPYVVFGEDHSFPEPTWGAELIGAFESDSRVVAVAPVMVNPNPVHPVSRAQFAAYFARAGRDRWEPGNHVVNGLPWHNSAYRTDVLRTFGEELGRAMEVEGFLQESIAQAMPDSRFVLAARTATHHVNVSVLGPACRHGFVGGRIFAAKRSVRLGWSPIWRFVHAMSSPLVPFVRLSRDRQLLNATVRSPLDAVNLWMHAFAMAVSHAAGEATGLLFGAANQIPVYSNFECRRARFVRPADRMLLED